MTMTEKVKAELWSTKVALEKAMDLAPAKSFLWHRMDKMWDELDALQTDLGGGDGGPDSRYTEQGGWIAIPRSSRCDYGNQGPNEYANTRP